MEKWLEKSLQRLDMRQVVLSSSSSQTIDVLCGDILLLPLVSGELPEVVLPGIWEVPKKTLWLINDRINDSNTPQNEIYFILYMQLYVSFSLGFPILGGSGDCKP